MIKSILTYGVLIILMLVPYQSFAQQQTGSQIIHSRVPGMIKKRGLTPIRSMKKTKQLKLVIDLPLRNQTELNQLLHQIYNPTSPKFHHYLSHSEFISDFGPASGNYQAVKAFIKANGFNVTKTYPDKMLLDISGTVSTIEKVFHVHMEIYKRPGKTSTFFAPDAQPSVNLNTTISSIEGLNNYMIPKPAGNGIVNQVNSHFTKNYKKKNAKTLLTNSNYTGSFYGRDFRKAYVPGISLEGQGQKVGLLEFNHICPKR